MEKVVGFTMLNSLANIFILVDPYKKHDGHLGVCVCVCVKVIQSCPILCDPLVCNFPGSSDHEILKARILEWVPIPFLRGSS